jgi:hypothetical protein
VLELDLEGVKMQTVGEGRAGRREKQKGGIACAASVKSQRFETAQHASYVVM